MKIKKNLEPIVSGLCAAIVISTLAFLTEQTILGIWLMFLLAQQCLLFLCFMT